MISLANLVSNPLMLADTDACSAHLSLGISHWPERREWLPQGIFHWL